jgi:hypothetical protein
VLKSTCPMSCERALYGCADLGDCTSRQGCMRRRGGARARTRDQAATPSRVYARVCMCMCVFDTHRAQHGHTLGPAVMRALLRHCRAEHDRHLQGATSPTSAQAQPR